jgi:hypothetical protein
MRTNTKERVAAKQAATAIIAAEVQAEQRPHGMVPVVFGEVYRRAQKALGAVGKTCFAVEYPRRVPWEVEGFTVFEVPLEDGGQVKEIHDFQTYARKLGVIEDCERPTGPGLEN